MLAIERLGSMRNPPVEHGVHKVDQCIGGSDGAIDAPVREGAQDRGP